MIRAGMTRLDRVGARLRHPALLKTRRLKAVEFYCSAEKEFAGNKRFDGLHGSGGRLLAPIK
jgi:hypothetical protein